MCENNFEKNMFLLFIWTYDKKLNNTLYRFISVTHAENFNEIDQHRETIDKYNRKI